MQDRNSDRWAIVCAPPGQRDLGAPDPWDVSLARSRHRRERAAALRPGLRRATTAKVSAAALAGAVVLVPGVEVGVADAAKRAAAADTGGSTLQTGARGAAVRALQEALGVRADGVFGPRTRAAVKRFQRAEGLSVDGVVGPRTRAALGLGGGGDAGAGAGGERSGSRDAGRATTRSAAGSSAVDVRALQRALGVEADGVVGPKTRAAVRAAERRLGLPVDGRPDARLVAALGGVGAAADGDGAADEPQRAVAEPDDGGGADASAAVASARAQLGKPYQSAGNGPSGFDCSGLTVWAFRAAGVSLPRTSYDQFRRGTSVARSEVRAGDLVFFDTNGPGASHVGIATSSTTAISATSSGVKEHPIASGYWGSHYVGARRLG